MYVDYRPIEEIIRDTVLPIINSSSFYFPIKKDLNIKDEHDTINEDISPTSLLSLLPMVNDLSSFSLKLTQEVFIYEFTYKCIYIYLHMYLFIELTQKYIYLSVYMCAS